MIPLIPLQEQYDCFEIYMTEEEAGKLFKKEYVAQLKKDGKLFDKNSEL